MNISYAMVMNKNMNIESKNINKNASPKRISNAEMNFANMTLGKANEIWEITDKLR